MCACLSFSWYYWEMTVILSHHMDSHQSRASWPRLLVWLQVSAVCAQITDTHIMLFKGNQVILKISTFQKGNGQVASADMFFYARLCNWPIVDVSNVKTMSIYGSVNF